ncbi:MAG: MmgE/PrpD family protein [Chloroflexi bacterium]|nr:MmgE/PrpD family protein [Chloroflexota bacterium]
MRRSAACDAPYLDKIAEHIASARWETLPADAQRATRRIFLDVLGSAAAACVLKRHDAATTRETLRIAASFAHITSYDVLREGATVRNLWTGAGARDGLLAAELAPMGYLGLPDAIRVTIERALPTFDAELFVKDLGTVYCVTRNYHKQYARNGNFDASVEATLRLVAEHGLTPQRIERILVDIYAPYHTLDVTRPRNALAAKFSLRYAVAAAAVQGHADHEAFTPEPSAGSAGCIRGALPIARADAPRDD